MLLMPHLPTPGAGVEDAPGRAGYSKSLNMWTICNKWNFRLHRIGKSFNGWLLKLGCHFFSTWQCIKCNSICTTGQVLKINNIYTYKEDNDIDIVRLTDVHVEHGCVYCSMFFFSKNKIITVRQTSQKYANIIWQLMENKESDGIMSGELWHEVSRDEELLQFDF